MVANQSNFDLRLISLLSLKDVLGKPVLSRLLDSSERIDVVDRRRHIPWVPVSDLSDRSTQDFATARLR